MMRHYTPLLATALICLFCWGCDSVRTEHPFGHAASPQDIADLSGRYIVDKETMQVHGTGDNTMRAAILKWEKETFTIQQLDVVVGLIDRPETHFYILNFRDRDMGDEVLPYDFILARKRDNTLIIWPANIPAFAQAVRDGKLGGTVTQKNVLNVVLEDPSEKLTAFLETEDLSTYFHWEEPFLLERVGD